MKPRAQIGDEILGNMIEVRRRELGLTQQQVARQIGTTPQCLQRYEAGDIRMSALVLFRIADALGLDVAALKQEAVNSMPKRMSPEDRAAARFARIGRRLARKPEVLEALVEMGLALLEESDVQDGGDALH